MAFDSQSADENGRYIALCSLSLCSLNMFVSVCVCVFVFIYVFMCKKLETYMQLICILIFKLDSICLS